MKWIVEVYRNKVTGLMLMYDPGHRIEDDPFFKTRDDEWESMGQFELQRYNPSLWPS